MAKIYVLTNSPKKYIELTYTMVELTISKLLFAVMLGDLNLEDIVVTQEGSQAGQTLPSAASDTY